MFEGERWLGGADLLIVNKFGKRESEGKGLVPVIAATLSSGNPVLVGVNGLNLSTFLAFCDNKATALPVDPAQVVDWWHADCAAPATLAGAG